jgi:hypothetical protein
MTMQENEKWKDIIQRGYMKRGMFLSLCWPLKESFSIVKK